MPTFSSLAILITAPKLTARKSKTACMSTTSHNNRDVVMKCCDVVVSLVVIVLQVL